MPEEKLSPEVQQAIAQLQQGQQQLQQFAMQRQSIMIQKMEIEKALEELEKADAKEEVFKVVGPVVIKTSRDKLQKELKERLETIDNIFKKVDAHEKKLTDKMKESQAFVEKAFGIKPGEGESTAG